MASSFGGTIKLQGESEYRKALSEITSNLKVLNSEMKVVTSQYNTNDKSAENLGKQNDVLNKKISEQEEKVKILTKALQDAEQETGENSATSKKWQIELNNAQAELNKLNKQLDNNSSVMENAGEVAEEASDGFTVMKGALADLTANAIQGAISKIGDLVSALFTLDEATEEYRQMTAKLEGSANSFGYSIDFAKDRYKEFYAYVSDDQMATNAITNLMGLKTSQESLTALTQSSIAVWSAYGDSIPLESLTESINETAQVGKVTGVMADALNWAGISEDEFNKKLEATSTTQERADLIAKILNDTYGESKKTYDEMTGSIQEANKAELELKETQAQLGEIIEPVNTALAQLKNDALEAILPIIEEVCQWFLDFKNYLSENEEVAIALEAGLVILAGAFGVLAGALAIQGLITGVTKAIALLNTTLLANPITLIVSLIAGLVAGFIYLWNNCEEFRKFFINMWNSIKEIVKNVTTAIVQFFTGAWDGIKNVWETVTTFFSNIWINTKNIFGDVKNWFVNVFKGAWDGIKNVFSNWGSFFGSLWTKIKDKFKDIGTNIGNTISNTVKAGINGIISSIENVINKGIGLINGAINIINKIPGVNIGKIQELNLPKLARGGVLDDGARTVIAGEDGAEAIVPLENNTEWIKKVANELQGSMFNSLDINRTVDKISDTINTRSTNYNYDNYVNAFKQALSEMKIELDDEVAGKFVERTVTNLVYT